MGCSQILAQTDRAEAWGTGSLGPWVWLHVVCPKATAAVQRENCEVAGNGATLGLPSALPSLWDLGPYNLGDSLIPLNRLFKIWLFLCQRVDQLQYSCLQLKATLLFHVLLEPPECSGTLERVTIWSISQQLSWFLTLQTSQAEKVFSQVACYRLPFWKQPP